LRARDGTITTFDVPGAIFTVAGSVNDQDAIAGTWLDQNGVSHAFIKSSGGVITPFDPPGPSQTYSAWINNSGVIAGAYQPSPSGFPVGYIRAADGSYTTFTAPMNLSLGSVDSINATGDVAGRVDSNELYIRQSDGVFDLKSLPVGTSSAIIKRSEVVAVRGVNVGDQVVGTIEKSIGFPNTIHINKPFVWSGTDFTQFEKSEGTSEAFGINDNGDVVGYVNNGTTGFLRASSGQVMFFTVGPVNTVPVAINNSGVICGSFTGRVRTSVLR
jgi:hypothetical protein